ncbi:MAG: hypothetical protein H6577_12680 [Lewinellaceae bacterium]|nr:hypothetical protein [Saprospiraceae bacterium]MCB9338977.1 hypothetical protein [Lewinellaceae bacterium]
MKNIWFIIFLLSSPCWMQAQTVTVSESLQIRDDVSYDIINDQRGNVLLFRDQGTKFEVQAFDNLMQMAWEKEIELDKKRPEILKVAPMGGDFAVLYQFRQKFDILLKIHRYNPGANLVDSVTIKNIGSKFYAPKFDVVISEDKKAALIWFVEQGNNFTVFSFHMGRMKLLWEKSFVLDDFLMQRDFEQMLVDNEGNMYMILNKENRKSRNSEPFFEILKCGTATGEDIQRFICPMDGHLIYDAHFSFDNLNNHLIAGGFYSIDNLIKAEGYFYMRISPDNPSGAVKAFHPFDDEFVAVLLEKERAKNKGLPEVSVQELVLRTDGGIILIGELNKAFQRGMAVGGAYSRTGLRPIIDYYYDDVFLISIHPTGEVHWKVILHKKQYSQDDEAAYSSYFLAKTPTALRVIFNDEIKSENTVSEYVITGSGDFDRNAVLNTERKELSLRFREAVQTAANQIVVPSERRNKLKLVKITY